MSTSLHCRGENIRDLPELNIFGVRDECLGGDWYGMIRGWHYRISPTETSAKMRVKAKLMKRPGQTAIVPAPKLLRHLVSLFMLVFGSFQLISAQTYLQTAINFTVEDLDGQTHELFDYLDAGKYVVLDFFYSTCNPCVGSVPFLNHAFEKFGCNNEDVVFLGINYGETDLDVFNYVQNTGYLLPAASGWQGGSNNVIYDYGIFAFPTVILIAPDKDIINQDIFPVNTYNLNYALENQAGLSASEGCFAVATWTVEQEVENGLQTIELLTNPLSGNILPLRLALSEPLQMDAALFNATGQHLQSWPMLQLPQNTTHYDLTLQQPLAPGWYLLQVQSDRGDALGLPFLFVQ